MRLRRVTPPARAWLGLSAGLAVAALAGYGLPSGALAWRADAPWSVWRWFTAVAVHWTALHLGANLAGLALLAWLGASARLPSGAAWAWCAAWPLTQAPLMLVGELRAYGGLSGVLHAGAVIAATYMLCRSRGAPRCIGLGVLAGVALKLWLEAPWQVPLQADAAWGFPVAVIAHATGALTGLACAVIALGVNRGSA
ncbi:hypothetical protein M8A51_06890 [Schlegelella sp. S2-27]|uniref:Rhomboid family GlyGly-CTERM serine protease n=1 Tax=Caldimonas mangrovi TaxID=2944811 RepID=A0ABT0YKI7_9BURK|nr:hypothetical protein [Caldimonas mangrovi]MCM5679255.1 hypothetical protein [Caldimonas mangrovi]